MKRRILTGLLILSSVSMATAAELSQYAANKAMQANQLAQDEKLPQAIQVLVKAEPGRAYDKAYLARMLGVFYWQSEQVKPAIKQLSYAVSSGELQDEQAWTTRKMLADLLTMNHDYSQALPHYYKLTQSVPKNEKASEIWLRIAQIQYQMNQWRKVLSAMERYEAFRLPDAIPPLSVKLGTQFQLEQWKNAILTLKRLIALEPDKTN